MCSVLGGIRSRELLTVYVVPYCAPVASLFYCLFYFVLFCFALSSNGRGLPSSLDGSVSNKGKVSPKSFTGSLPSTGPRRCRDLPTPREEA